MTDPLKPYIRNCQQFGEWSVTASVSNSLTVYIQNTATALVVQPTHDNLNLNANIQVANTDVSTSNPIPVVGSAAVGGALGNPVVIGMSDFASGLRTVPDTLLFSGVDMQIMVQFDADLHAPQFTSLGDHVVAGGVAHDSADSSIRGPVKIGGKAKTQFTEPSAVSTNNDITDAFFDLKGYQHNKVHPDRIGSSATSLFSSASFGTTTTGNSSAVDLERFSKALIYVNIDDTGTTTDIRLKAQFSRDGGTSWYDLAWDAWVDMRWSSIQMPVAEVIPIEIPNGQDFRLSVVTSGTSATASYVLSAYIEALTNG